jgi:hypothetical protein
MECSIILNQSLVLGGAKFYNLWNVNTDHKELEWCFIDNYTEVGEWIPKLTTTYGWDMVV